MLFYFVLFVHITDRSPEEHSTQHAAFSAFRNENHTDAAVTSPVVIVLIKRLTKIVASSRRGLTEYDQKLPYVSNYEDYVFQQNTLFSRSEKNETNEYRRLRKENELCAMNHEKTIENVFENDYQIEEIARRNAPTINLKLTVINSAIRDCTIKSTKKKYRMVPIHEARQLEHLSSIDRTIDVSCEILCVQCRQLIERSSKKCNKKLYQVSIVSRLCEWNIKSETFLGQLQSAFQLLASRKGRCYSFVPLTDLRSFESPTVSLKIPSSIVNSLCFKRVKVVSRSVRVTIYREFSAQTHRASDSYRQQFQERSSTWNAEFQMRQFQISLQTKTFKCMKVEQTKTKVQHLHRDSISESAKYHWKISINKLKQNEFLAPRVLLNTHTLLHTYHLVPNSVPRSIIFFNHSLPKLTMLDLLIVQGCQAATGVSLPRGSSSLIKFLLANHTLVNSSSSLAKTDLFARNLRVIFSNLEICKLSRECCICKKKKPRGEMLQTILRLRMISRRGTPCVQNETEHLQFDQPRREASTKRTIGNTLSLHPKGTKKLSNVLTKEKTEKKDKRRRNETNYRQTNERKKQKASQELKQLPHCGVLFRGKRLVLRTSDELRVEDGVSVCDMSKASRLLRQKKLDRRWMQTAEKKRRRRRRRRRRRKGIIINKKKKKKKKKKKRRNKDEESTRESRGKEKRFLTGYISYCRTLKKEKKNSASCSACETKYQTKFLEQLCRCSQDDVSVPERGTKCYRSLIKIIVECTSRSSDCDNDQLKKCEIADGRLRLVRNGLVQGETSMLPMGTNREIFGEDRVAFCLKKFN
ncbi:hypothetical protein WN51_06117 [Melipona quadrifasciata]|uniref:Uncharacterized protein n=1 Tax=Melipona quadrifasciata TaxID=166423 RepID=A0A0M8ZRL6_9HYME|nr:hypothetical protein WN51_06117 [Melipona quadrifasciata]